MKILIKTKLIDENHIEVRDYELHKDKLKLIHCIALDYKLCNHEKDEFMLLSLAQQKKGKFLNQQQSKFPPYSYYGIYKFLWKPQKPYTNIDTQSITIPNILSGLTPEQIAELRKKLGLKPK